MHRGSKCVLVCVVESALVPGSRSPRGSLVFAGLSIDAKDPPIACHALGWMADGSTCRAITRLFECETGP